MLRTLVQRASPGELEGLTLLTGVLLLVALALLLGTLAYATLASRALDLHFVVRVGGQGGAQRAGLRNAFLLAVGMIGMVVAWNLGHGQTAVVRSLVGIGAGLLCVLVVWASWRSLVKAGLRQQAEGLEGTQKAAGIVHHLRGCFSRSDLLEMTSRELAEALGTERVAIFLESREQYRIAHSIGSAPPPELMFTAGSLLVRQLSQGGGSAVSVGDAQRGTRTVLFSSIPPLAEAEAARLEALDAKVLVPLSQEDGLAGFLTLGPKTDGTEYSGSDLRMLERVGQELAACLGRVDGVVEYADRRVRSTKEERERQMAIEFKNELTAGWMEQAPGLEYAATSIATADAETESYGFLKLPDQNLGILLVRGAGSQASTAIKLAHLHGWAGGRADLGTGELQRELARLRLEAAGEEAFRIWLFYGRYEWRTQQLRYLNAGYPAPFVLRRTSDGAQVLRLNGRPTVKEEETSEGNFGLQPGDLVVAASRGLLGVKNADGEGWGEGRLIETVLSWQSQRAADIAELVLRTARAFSPEPEPKGDIAVVVLRSVPMDGGRAA